ncbi:retrotransposon protein, putative, ty1-copia subclass [Tanacetum coccineum]
MKGYVDQLKRLGYMLPQDLILSLILNDLTKDFSRFVRNYNMHNMGKTVGELHDMLIEYEKGLPKKAETPQLMMIRGGKIQKANKKSLKSKGKGKANGKGNDKQVYIPKPSAKEHPAKDDACHHCKEVGHWKRNCPLYLAELLKRKKQVGSTSSLVVLVMFIYFKNKRHEVFETFKVFKNEVKNQLGKTIKALRSDRGGEYISQEFKDYLKACGIIQQLTPPYAPQHNGVSERRNRTWLDMVRSMMNLTLPLSFWDYALDIATCISDTQKETARSFLGPEELEEIQDEDTSPSENTSEIPIEVKGFEPPQEEVVPVRRSARTHQAPDRLCLNVEVEEHSLWDLNESANYKAAILDPKSDKWLDAMNAEMQSINISSSGTWLIFLLIVRLLGANDFLRKRLTWMTLYTPIKLVLQQKGFTQTYGVDYEEMFSPVADIRAIRILIAIATFYDYEIWQIDVKTDY